MAEVTGKTDKDGNFEFELDLPDYFAGQPLENEICYRCDGKHCTRKGKGRCF